MYICKLPLYSSELFCLFDKRQMKSYNSLIIIIVPDISCGFMTIPSVTIEMSQAMRICVLCHANNKGADQPAHLRSLISTFVVHCLDSIIPLDSIAKISRL